MCRMMKVEAVQVDLNSSLGRQRMRGRRREGKRERIGKG